MEGFSKGGVLPFWQSPLISVQSLLRFGPDEMGDVLDRDPRAFLIKSDIGSVSFFYARYPEVYDWDGGLMVTTGAIVETTTPTNYVLVFFRQSWSSLPSKFWLPGIVC